MMNLMHTATFSNWSSVALISFYGCDKFGGNGIRFRQSMRHRMYI